MRVISQAPIQFKCRACGSVNEGDENEFKDRHTNPPTWNAECGSCHNTNVVSPTPLVAKAAALAARAFG